MQEDNTKRDSELEKKIIPALIIYVCEHNESLIGGILKSVTSKKESIEKVWNNFFYIASVDEKNYRNICNCINDICTSEGLDFARGDSFKSSTLECYLNSIFKSVEPTVFREKKNYGCLKKLRERIECLCKYKKDKDGRPIYKVEDFYGATTIINEAIDERNKAEHTATDGSISESLIKGFFAATVIYDYIKELGSYFEISTNAKEGVTIKVINQVDNSVIIKSCKGVRGISSILIDSKDFKDSNELKLTLEISAPNFSTKSIEYTARLGLFLLNNKPYNVNLQKQGKEISNRRASKEEKNVKKPYIEKKDDMAARKLLQLENKQLDNNQRIIERKKTKDSSKDTYIVSTNSASSTNTDNLVKELSKALNAVTGPRICNACGNHVQEDAFDKETLRCFNCVNTALSLIEEGDNYVKASRIKSNDLKDIDSAVEKYKDALNYSSKEQKYDVNSKLGHCYFLLQKYSDAINAFVHAGNNPMGLFYLGKCYQEGKGVNKDPEKAFGYFKKAADLGHAESQEFVATQYYEGKDLEQDYKLAFDYFKKAADQGIVNAQYMTGMMCKNGQGQDKNDDNAYIYFLKAADGKNLKAQYELATLLLEGKVVKHDEEGAFKWYLNAADQGLPEAMLKVAQMYGKKSNYEPALEWYRKAVEAKAPNAEKELLETLVKRAMLAHDFGEFEYELKLYFEAAGMGDENHYRNIADLYYKEEYKGYILKDDEKAKDWYLKAISKGDVSANIPLGDIYFNKMDLNNAETCFRKALNAGCNDAKMPLARLLNKRANTLLGYDVSGKSDSFDKTILNKVIVK